MNCDLFERQAADWLGHRLSPERSRLMVAHREGCEACRRFALTESRLRESWQDLSQVTPTVDLWTRVGPRLETQPKTKRFWTGKKVRSAPRWAMGGALIMAAMAIYSFHLMPPDRSGIIKTHPQETVAPQGGVMAFSALGDVSQNNPAVDDPVGVNMEAVWININASRKEPIKP